jgi:hypothetical protein
MTSEQAISFLQSLPDDMGDVNLSSGETITDMKIFKEIHIIRLRDVNPKSRIYTSTLDRVIILKSILQRT